MSTGRSRRPVRVGAAALGAVGLAAVVAGCAPAAARTADQGTQAQAWQRVTDCIRRNGQPDWPDPTPGPDGRFPASAVDQPGAKQVLLSPPAACRSLVPAGGIRVAS